jgi:alpha-D-ribose 1-methylphosphonate 5-triphosphate synthase subunit PhnL
MSRQLRSMPPIAMCVVELIDASARRRRFAAIVGIFHDTDVRDAVATRVHEVLPPASPAGVSP